MEIHSGKSTSKTNLLLSLSVGLKGLLSVVLWIIGFFRLSKEDQFAAGISMSDNRRDE